MAGSKLPFIIFFAALFLFDFFILVTPYLASSGNPVSDALYVAFAPTCHQLTSRSLCVFKSKVDGSYSIGDCFATPELRLTKQTVVDYADKTGYKMTVCSRDVAIYFAMLLGLIILPFIWKIGTEDWPNKWILVAAAIPTAIDGTTQLFGLRESNNALRLWTGFIIGVVLPFYILPMLNSLYAFILEKIGRGKAGKKKD
jgi:uncharacterized membrane protein